MSTRAMRKLRGDTLDDDLKKINDSRADHDRDEDDDDDDSPAAGGGRGGGGARPKQRINPFEMVSIRMIETWNAKMYPPRNQGWSQCGSDFRPWKLL